MSSLYENKKYIIHKQTGEKLEFFILNESLYLKISKDHSAVLKEEKLTDNIKCYDIDLDTEENLHTIYLTTLGELYYMNNTHAKWEKKILKEFGPQSNSIDFLNILVPKKTVHIFYSFKNIISNNIYRIIHLYCDNKKWKFCSLESIIQVENTLPYIIDCDKSGNLYFLYKKKTSCFYFRVFSNTNKSWKSFGKIKFNIDVSEIKTILVDSKNILHFLYKSKSNTNEIYHVYREKNRDFSLPNFIYIDENQNISPKFFEADKKLWIIWKYVDKAHYMYSTDYGISWCEFKTIDLHELININFISSNYKNICLYKKISTIGVIEDESLYLLGLDNLEVLENKNSYLEDTGEILEVKAEVQNEFISKESDKHIHFDYQEDILETTDNNLEDSDSNLEKENNANSGYIQLQSNEQINYNHKADISLGNDNDFKDYKFKLVDGDKPEKEYEEKQSSKQIYYNSDVSERKNHIIMVSKEKKKTLLERIYDFLSGK